MGELEDKVGEPEPVFGPQQEKTGPMPALEAKVESYEVPKEKGISLKRIALATIGYGVAGAALSGGGLLMSATALVGFGLSTYSEVKKKPMNLFYPGVGAVVGGIVGDTFSPDDWHVVDWFMTYGGAAAGAWLGYVKSTGK